MWKLVETRPTPKAIYNFRLYYSALVAAFSAVMVGYDSAFIGTSISLASFRTELKVDATHVSTNEWSTISSNIVIAYLVGCFGGCLFGLPVGYFLGRKFGMVTSACIVFLGVGLTCGTNASTGLSILYAGRVLEGLGVGIATNLVPLYLSEIAPPSIRGRLVGFYDFSWQVGGVVGFFINYGVTQNIPPSHTQWIIPFYVQMIPGGLFLLSVPILIKESPRWLLTKGRRELAIKNLCWVRKLDADHPYIVEEVADVERTVAEDAERVGTGFWAPFLHVWRSPLLVKRIFIGSTLFLFQNFTGINAINYYSPTIFKSVGVTGQSASLLSTGVFGLLKFALQVFWAIFLVDRVGRRSLLFLGSIWTCTCLFIIGAYIYQVNPGANGKSGTPALAFLYIWTVGYSISWTSTPWVYNSEIFPPGGVRAISQMCASASNWLWTIVVTKFTPYAFSGLGYDNNGYGVYFLFGSVTFVSFFFVYFLVPETKQIPLEAMERLWALRPSIANKTLMAELRAEHGLNPNAGTVPTDVDSEAGRVDKKAYEEERAEN